MSKITMTKADRLTTQLLAAAALLLLSSLGVNAQVAGDKPNIIFILADDQGWNGTSVQMHPDLPHSKSDYYRTPNIMKLAESGMRFSNAYSPGPMCSPTRASLQTGKSPAQLRMTNVGRSRSATPSQRLQLPPHTNSLSTNEITLGEMLGDAGYSTAWFGKWHLGGNRGPGAHGYDAHDGPTGNQDGNSDNPDNPKDIFGITKRGIAFMEQSVEAGKPFYLQLWHYAVHSPVQSLEETESAYRTRTTGRVHQNSSYAAMTEDLDTSVGMILDKLKELSIVDNTYVVYMSDHGAGGRSSNSPLRQGKGTLWEGGLRVPLIISGPGVKRGAYCQVPTAGWDLFPTFCELAEVQQSLPKGVEGASLTPLFASGQGELRREYQGIGFHFPHYRNNGVPYSTFLIENYKLVKFYETGQLLLYDLENDIGEQKDLSQQLPEKTAKMHRLLNRYLESIDAGLPIANPDFDPNATTTQQKRRNKRKSRRDGSLN